jgi:hypothetical protein
MTKNVSDYLIVLAKTAQDTSQIQVRSIRTLASLLSFKMCFMCLIEKKLALWPAILEAGYIYVKTQ